jgi:hypothetical protein
MAVSRNILTPPKHAPIFWIKAGSCEADPGPFPWAPSRRPCAPRNARATSQGTRQVTAGNRGSYAHRARDGAPGVNVAEAQEVVKSSGLRVAEFGESGEHDLADARAQARSTGLPPASVWRNGRWRRPPPRVPAESAARPRPHHSARERPDDFCPQMLSTACARLRPLRTRE